MRSGHPIRGAVLNAVELPPHLSFSQTSTFLSCGAKYRLERLEGHRGTPNWASLGGSAVHGLTEARDRLLWEHGVQSDPVTVDEFRTEFEKYIVKEEELSGVGREHFRHTGRKSKDWPDKWGYDYWMVMGPQWVAGWESWCAMTPWTIINPIYQDTNVSPFFVSSIEMEFELKLGTTKVRGAIDRVMEMPNGDLVVVDIKTSMRAPKSPEQLGLYACAVESVYGVRPKYGAYWMARDGGTGPVFNLDRFSLEFMSARYGTVRGQMERGEFLANPSDACSYCSVKQHCEIMRDEEVA